MTSTLLDILSYARPMGSKTEAAFRARYVYNLPGAVIDQHGNVHIAVGESRCLWSCHTDTVHARDIGRQRVEIDARGVIRLAKSRKARKAETRAADILKRWRDACAMAKARGEKEPLYPWKEIAQTSAYGGPNCLGADDGVGVYLLREMIARGIAGYYVFHHGEERGGVGSSALARTHASYLAENFDMAIALDRAGLGDVITHQGGRTCSDVFARSLAKGLNIADHTFDYSPCHGVYTDTAEYADIIPECSNLSVGYENQHSSRELVDTVHVARLLEALCQLDTGGLAVTRDPNVREQEREYLDWQRDWDRHYADAGKAVPGSRYIWEDEEDDYRRTMARDTPRRADDDDDFADTELSPLNDGQWWQRYARAQRAAGMAGDDDDHSGGTS